MAGIKFEHISKTYPGADKPVIKDLNLEIKDKEFIILVGPSGCGKSTTLRMIAGLEEITGGTLTIGDAVVNDVPPKERDIAMVFQSYALYPNMTVYKNIAFPLKVRKLSEREQEQRLPLIEEVAKAVREKAKAAVLKKNENADQASLDAAMDAAEQKYRAKAEKSAKYTSEEIDYKVHYVSDILDLGQYLERKPANLSGGQRQRVALGRAMVRSPKVFLLDEPLSNLDAKLRTEMRSQISLLHKRLDTTFVYVTHDQTEAMTIADRIAVMNKGDLMQFDTPRELYERPANMFVAGFIGSPEMNFFDVKILQDGDGYAMELAGQKVALSGITTPENLAPFVGRKVKMGIRPEAISLATKEASKSLPADEILPIHIKIAEFLGAEVYFYFDVEGVQHVGRVPSKYRLAADMDVKVVLDPKRCYFFNPDTQETLVYAEQAETEDLVF